MSNEWIRLVLRSDVDVASTRHVLTVIADAADKDGVCWPSLDYLVEATRLSKATVSRALAELESGGYLSRRRRRAQSSVLTLCRERLTEALNPHPEDSHGENPQDENPHGERLNPHHEDGLKEPSRTLTRPKRSKRPGASKPKTEEHPDARKLCDRLAELMIARECKRPTISKAWLDAGRLLLTNDGRDFDQALSVLEWSQTNPFWRKNILSMPTFRDKYDQLRLGAEERGELKPPAPRLDNVDRIRDWLKDEWRAGRTSEIQKRAGLRYEPPDVPPDVRGIDAEMRFHTDRAREWITQNLDEIVTRMNREDTAA